MIVKAQKQWQSVHIAHFDLIEENYTQLSKCIVVVLLAGAIF